MRGEGEEGAEESRGEAASGEVVVVCLDGGFAGEGVLAGQLDAEQFGQSGGIQQGFTWAKVGYGLMNLLGLGCDLEGGSDEEGDQACREPGGDGEEEQPDNPKISFK